MPLEVLALMLGRREKIVDGNFDHGNATGGLSFDAREACKDSFGVLSSFDSLEGFVYRGARFSERDSFGNIVFLFFKEIECNARERPYFALGLP
jgi:hypothetical protein